MWQHSGEQLFSAALADAEGKNRAEHDTAIGEVRQHLLHLLEQLYQTLYQSPNPEFEG